jgi:hypothetical protein
MSFCEIRTKKLFDSIHLPVHVFIQQETLSSVVSFLAIQTQMKGHLPLQIVSQPIM